MGEHLLSIPLVYWSARIREHLEQLSLLAILDCVGCYWFGLFTDIGKMILSRALVTALAPGSTLFLPHIKTRVLAVTLAATVGTFASISTI